MRLLIAVGDMKQIIKDLKSSNEALREYTWEDDDKR